MDGAVLSEWRDFFVAVASASAALTGLIIVAMSVTIERILADRTLPSRAGTTIAAMTMVLLVGLAALIPQHSPSLFGLEAIVMGLLVLAACTRMTQRMFSDPNRAQPLANVLRSGIITLPTLLVTIGGLILSIGFASGLVWIAAGMITTIAGAMANAWVLLVEIQR